MGARDLDHLRADVAAVEKGPLGAERSLGWRSLPGRSGGSDLATSSCVTSP